MARTHCTDEHYYRVRLVSVMSDGSLSYHYNGPYSAKGTATAQLKRRLRLNGNISPELSGVEITEPITWKDV